MIIGLDLGISSTKVVAFINRRLHSKEIWEGAFLPEQLTAFINNLGQQVERIAVTGVGSKSMRGKLLGYPTVYVDEFEANAASAGHLCQKNEYIVVSMGSGTSFVHVKGNESSHIGGSALGGGTVLSLFHIMVSLGNWPQIRQLASNGSLRDIDLTIGDVSKQALPGLPLDTTATNFGKASIHSKPDDLTLGLINMVLQNIGVMAYLAGSGRGVDTFVVIGRMATLPHADEIFERLSTLYGIHFIVAREASHMTAIGAALYSTPNP